jgi:hypothetical protein
MIARQLRHAVCALVLLSPAAVAAQPRPSASAAADAQGLARAKAQEGLKLYGADRWSEALASFREADTLFHAPSVTLYVARCQRKLGKLLDARTTYVRILAEDLPPGAPPAFVSAHADAGKELEIVRERLPTLQVAITGVPAAEARVTVNGAPFADEKKELDPGSYTVEARAGAGAPILRTVTLAEGSHETLTLDLRAGAAAPAMTERSSGWFVPGAVTLGVGAVGLAVGAVTGVLALGKVSDLKAACPDHACPSSLKGEASTGTALGNVSTTAFVVGGAAAAAGVVLLLVQRPSGRPTETAWRARLGLGRVDVEGTF